MPIDSELRALRPGDRVYRVLCTGGLCIEVRPSDAKLWCSRRAGRSSRAALGEYPVVSLAEARTWRGNACTPIKGRSRYTPRECSEVEKGGNYFCQTFKDVLITTKSRHKADRSPYGVDGLSEAIQPSIALSSSK
ncbi:Arm DNA-binding domain-containing protein [Dyella sp.]|uniref:Arm DNA-binding domain-containing protein n=1 Tax=Dyella sp. TaxID=1869338 RepID=UPI0039C8A2B5